MSQCSPLHNLTYWQVCKIVAIAKGASDVQFTRGRFAALIDLPMIS
jgi:hypothetical protein